MVFVDLVFSAAMAIALAALFTTGFAPNDTPLSGRAWRDVAGFFLLVLVGTRAARIWVPNLPGWLNALMPFAAAAIIGAVFAAAPAGRRLRGDPPAAATGGIGSGMQATLFVMVMFFLSILVIVGYLNRAPPN